MIVFGHRGAPSERPENTLESFRHALALGADVIETDVHVTADGCVVVHHDEDGKRSAGVDRKIAELDLREVQTWDVATGPRKTSPRVVCDLPHRVPTLDAVLEELDGVRLNIDVKPNGDQAAQRVIDVISRHRAESRVLLTSFHDKTVQAIRRLGYRGETGLARNEVLFALSLPKRVAKRLVHGNRVQIPVAFGPMRLDTESVIGRFHARGLAVDYWVVDDPKEASRLSDLGADGVMTDDVREIVRAR